MAKKEAKANGKALRARGREWNTHLKPEGKKLVSRLRRRAGKLATQHDPLYGMDIDRTCIRIEERS